MIIQRNKTLNDIFRFTVIFILLTVNITIAEWSKPLNAKIPSTCRTDSKNPKGTVIPYVLGKVELEDVNFFAAKNAHANTELCFSPCSKYLAIGTYLGFIKVYDVYKKKIIWEKKIAEGMVKKIDYSKDGKRLIVGEQSIEGNIYSFNAENGKEIWRYSLSKDIESGKPWKKDEPYKIYTQPGCYSLKSLDNGDCIALGIHSWSESNNYQHRKRISRIYRISKEGKVLWKFPENDNAQRTIIYMDSDDKGETIAFLPTTKGINTPDNYYLKEGSLCLLDGSNGKLKHTHSFSPLKPYFNYVGFWQSVSVSNSGDRISIGTQDGRSYLFNTSPFSVIKEYAYGTPVLLSGVPVSAYASYTKNAPDRKIYFQTSNSNVVSVNASRTVSTPPGMHPNQNLINVVNPDGSMAWRYKSQYSCENFWISSDGRWMMTTAFKNKGKNNQISGALLFDTHRPGGGSKKFLYFYRVKGRVFFQAAMAPDGSAFAIAESPFSHPSSELIKGTYQVHIIR